MENDIIFNEKQIYRFWKKVKASKKNFYNNIPCWEWNGGLRDGYGECKINGRTISSHRFSWMIRNGKIQNGLLVLHKCDNRICVNPDHLFLGDHDDNMNDMVTKGRSAKGERQGSNKLSEENILEIRKMLYDNISQTKIANIFNVTRQNIWRIKNGKSWKWL